MKRCLTLSLLLLLVCADAGAASVNKCVGKNRVVYSDKPCAPGQREEPIKASMTSFSGSESSSNNRAALGRFSGSQARTVQVDATPAPPSQTYSSCPYR